MKTALARTRGAARITNTSHPAFQGLTEGNRKTFFFPFTNRLPLHARMSRFTRQVTTIFLATAPAFGFAGLLAGTLAGHALVTWLAVGAGKWIGGRISEKVLYRLSGGLFIAFALVSLQQALR